MWTIKTILVPTDFSKGSEAALDAAVTLAKKFDAGIVLMHAYQLPVYPYSPNATVTPADLVAHIDQGAGKALETAAAAYAASGIRITTALKAGIPWEQILHAAKEFDAGLIVIGSRGLRGLPRALLGSTAERVVRYSPVPVTTLHGPVQEEQPSEGAKAANDLVDRWLI